jgi:hypothetical protein
MGLSRCVLQLVPWGLLRHGMLGDSCIRKGGYHGSAAHLRLLMLYCEGCVQAVLSPTLLHMACRTSDTTWCRQVAAVCVHVPLTENCIIILSGLLLIVLGNRSSKATIVATLLSMALESSAGQDVFLGFPEGILVAPEQTPLC